MIGHTKEPWKVVNENGFVSVINADTGVVVFPEMHANDCKEDIRRTVACVNALQHISTESLESGHMQNLVMQVRIAEEQRDELLSALSGLMRVENHDRIIPIGKEWDAARAAIAKVVDA